VDTPVKSPGTQLIAGFLTLLLNGALTAPARADCTGDIRTVRNEAATIKDERRRQELEKLLEKAEKDNGAGGAQLCADAVQHARALLK
jgi:hypothetical protein